MTKCSLNSCFTVHYFLPKISSFTLVLSITIVLDRLKLHIFYFEKWRTIRKVVGGGGCGWGIFNPQDFFSLSNSLYEFFGGRSMGLNIFLGLIGVHEFFFHLIFPCANIFFGLRPLLPPDKFSNGPSLNLTFAVFRKRHSKSLYYLSRQVSHKTCFSRSLVGLLLLSRGSSFFCSCKFRVQFRWW